MIVLLFIHSIGRWLVLASLLTSLVVAGRGFKKNLQFDRKANLLRHWTATFAHIQLVVGVLLAFRSPYFAFFWENNAEAWSYAEPVFFGLVHPLLMLVSITLLTVGSAKAKRKEQDRDKYKTMLIWFSVAALVLFIAIPWPFSPFSARPFFPNH